MNKIITAHDKDNVLGFFVNIGPSWQSRFFSPEVHIPGYYYEDVVIMLQQFDRLGFINKTVQSLGGFMDFRITLDAHDFLRSGGFQMQELEIQKNLSCLLDDLIEFKGNPDKTDTMTWDLVVKIEKVSLLLQEAIPLIAV